MLTPEKTEGANLENWIIKFRRWIEGKRGKEVKRKGRRRK
jgi:hypothetical protein